MAQQSFVATAVKLLHEGRRVSAEQSWQQLWSFLFLFYLMKSTLIYKL